MAIATPSSEGPGLSDQLQLQRRTVDFDTFDITVQQILSMLGSKAIDIAPVYQRQFRWDDTRCSQLIESVFLGIPVPSLFMAANRDGTWELVDGVQRLSSIVKFAGSDDLRTSLAMDTPLKLCGLEKLASFNNHSFSDLPRSVQLQFELRPLKVVTLSDKSDAVVRFDLFERLNTGGIALTDQEIRDCVFRGRFSDLLADLAKDLNFRKVLRLPAKQESDGTREECVLRFFAYLHKYKEFVHSVKDFLNDYMKQASTSFDYELGEKIFRNTFKQLSAGLPSGLMRPHRRGTTSLILYEGVAVGAALAILKKHKINLIGIGKWLNLWN